MLVLSRIVDQKIIITAPDGTLITLIVVEVRGDKVRIGVDAPKSWTVNREEIQMAIDAEKLNADDPDYPRGLRSIKGFGEKTIDAIENDDVTVFVQCKRCGSIVEWLSKNVRSAESDQE